MIAVKIVKRLLDGHNETAANDIQDVFDEGQESSIPNENLSL